MALSWSEKYRRYRKLALDLGIVTDSEMAWLHGFYRPYWGGPTASLAARRSNQLRWRLAHRLVFTDEKFAEVEAFIERSKSYVKYRPTNGRFSAT